MTRQDPFALAGRVALVTGGTGGIGRAISAGFAAAGVRVYLSGRDADQAAAAAAAIGAETGGCCMAVAGDLRTLDGARSIASELRRREQSLHILVNNAGCEATAELGSFSESDWDDVLSVNLKTPFFLVQMLLDLLKSGATAAHPASIINIGSIGGIRPGAKENYSYTTSKSALHHLTTLLAKRLGPEDIIVNAIAPGFFRTSMTQDVGAAAVAALVGTIPRGRIGNDRDLVALTGFLASAGAGYMTGAVIPLAGGMTL